MIKYRVSVLPPDQNKNILLWKIQSQWSIHDPIHQVKIIAYDMNNHRKQKQVAVRVVGLLIGCVVIFVILYSLQSWREEKAEIIEGLYNVMELECQAIDSYFIQLENNMRILADNLGDFETADALAQGYRLTQHFKELRPEFFNINVSRADGQILFTAKNPPAPNLPTLAQEPSFLQFKKESDRSQDLDIGRPLEGLISKQWIIPIRFKLRDADGRLSHVINAHMPLTFLQNFWENAPFTKKASLGLIRDDGFLVSRHPVSRHLDIATIYGQPRSGELINHLREQHFPHKGYVEGPSSLDGPDFLTSYQRLEHFPITLFIALPSSEVRHAWWGRVRVSYSLAAAILAAGIAFYFFTLAEEAKRKSGELYRIMFEKNRSVVLLIDPVSAAIVDANQAACAFYGYQREQLLGMRLTDINTIFPQQVNAEMAMAKGESGYFHYKHRLASGEIRDVEVHSSPLEIEGRTLLHSIIHDITDRLLAERALEESKKEYDEMVARVPVGIYRLRMTTTGVRTFEYVSPRWCQLTQLNSDAVVGDAELAYARIHPDDLPRLQEAEEEARKHLKKFAWQGRLVVDNKVRFMQVDSTPRIVENGDILWTGMLSDITSRKIDEEELKSLNDELERRVEKRTYELQVVQQQYLHAEKLSAIGKLAASIAHEFNSPLQSVMTVMKGLKKTAGLEDTDVKMLELAIGESERMKKLIASLRDFNRPSSDRKSFIDVNQSIESILTLTKSDFGKKKITVTTHFSSHLPQILAVPDQFKQILLNLLTNAIDACAGSGGEIKISTYHDGDCVAVAIKDTGVGITAENMEHIFRPFFTTKAEVKGTGLGLAVSYGIIKNHQGELRVESEPGVGTTFTVLLPINTEENTVPAA